MIEKNMRKLGLIGGIGPESTIHYYRYFIKQYRQRFQTDHYPEFVVQSIDMTRMLELVYTAQWDELVDFLAQHINALKDLDVDYVAMASNTPHIVYDQLSQAVDVEVVSIILETCKVIAGLDINKALLLGTKSTMSAGFYQAAGREYEIEILTPSKADMDYVHRAYMEELVHNVIKPETKSRLIKIVSEQAQGADISGLILGGTELPLILNSDDFPSLSVFDTTQIHVSALLDRMDA